MSEDNSGELITINSEQYQVLSERRNHYDTLLWQVPTIGIAAQGLLVSSAIELIEKFRTSSLFLFLSFIVGFCVILGFRNLRFHEVEDSKLLTKYEQSRAIDGFVVFHGRRGPSPSAYYVWLFLLLGIAGLELFFGVLQFLRSF